MHESVPKQYRKALIRLGHPCNNRCLFCHSAARNERILSTAQAMDKIRDAAGQGADMIVFSGGEPTIRNDIFSLCEYTKTSGLEAGIITNGRMLCYKEFTDRLMGLDLKYVLVSLHGHDAETHDMLTGTQGFAQTMAGLRNMAGRAGQLVVNTVVTRFNARHLGDIARLLQPFAPLHYKISMPEPRGGIIENPGQVLAPNQAAQAVLGFLSQHNAQAGVTVGVDGMTPCLLPEFFHLNDDLFTHGFFLISEPDEESFFPPDHGDRAMSPDCPLCSFYRSCPGIYRKYFELFADIRLEPI